MKLTFKTSLRFEIVVSLALLLAAAVGLVGMVVLNYAQREMVALKVETGLAMARGIEEVMKGNPGPQQLRSLLFALSGTGFERMVVVDAKGDVLAVSGPWPWESHPDQADLETAMKARQEVTFLRRPMFLHWSPDLSLALAVPVFDGPRLIGAVGLYSPLNQLRVTWAKTTWIILVYLALDTLITVLFGTYLLSRRLVEPLKRLNRRVSDLADGRFEPDKPTIKDNNEIGRLEEAFESMAVRIIESRVSLEENLASLQEAQEQVIRSEKMATVGRLAAGLAHELGNPLGAVLGFVHLLKRPDLNERERADFLQRTEDELTRMDSIIRSLLDFARPAKVTPGPVSLGQVAAHALGLAEVQKWFRGLEVVSDLAPELPAARGEANRLTQVALNLLANAGQAMNGRGRLTVSTGLWSGSEVYLSVSDTGPGVDAEDAPHIFEPFFTRKEPGQGTGLGLSVSLSIVQSFGGRIQLDDSPGGGARFTVILPIERLA